MAEATEAWGQNLLDMLEGSTVWDELDALLRAEIMLARVVTADIHSRDDITLRVVNAHVAARLAHDALRVAIIAVVEREA